MREQHVLTDIKKQVKIMGDLFGCHSSWRHGVTVTEVQKQCCLFWESEGKQHKTTNYPSKWIWISFHFSLYASNCWNGRPWDLEIEIYSMLMVWEGGEWIGHGGVGIPQGNLLITFAGLRRCRAPGLVACRMLIPWLTVGLKKLMTTIISKAIALNFPWASNAW